MSDADLAERLAEIDRQILATELAEEAAVRALERLGAGTARRPDADLRAVLAASTALATA